MKRAKPPRVVVLCWDEERSRWTLKSPVVPAYLAPTWPVTARYVLAAPTARGERRKGKR